MSLELYQRYEIVFLAKNQCEPKFSINRIAKLVNCGRSTVIRWLKRWDETKDLRDRERTGRPRKTTTEQDDIIINVVKQDPDERFTSQQIQEQVKGDGINVNERIIYRRLNEAEFQYSKPLLIEHHQNKRLRWATSMLNFHWNRVMASDETVFRLHNVKHFYWQRRGERKMCRTTKHTIKVNA
ncbi:unnamed protein product [Rotaria sp. Silwood2]|nr:unnamed protein product [Rotaria sp. Silwood2]CAF4668682.1 unnamed protein product [Rotaria sp. Silwood2]